jgi:hypothetical protein
MPMSCILRVSGGDLSADELARSTSLKPYRIFRKGELGTIKSKGPLTESAAYYLVSDQDFNRLEGQIAEAIAFLEAEGAAVRNLVRFAGVERACLDFGAEWRDVVVQCDVFPSALLRLAGDLGLDLHVTHYPTPEPEAAESAGA